MQDAETRAAIARLIRQIEAPQPRINDVERRSVQRRIRGRAHRGFTIVAAAMLALAGVLGPLWLLGPLRDSSPPTTRPAILSRDFDIGGIHVRMPDDWDAEVYAVPGYIRPIIRLSTFPLPEIDDIDAGDARGRMTQGDVLISLTEHLWCPCPGFEPTDFPIALRPEDFDTPFDVWHALRPDVEEVPSTHAFARRTFVEQHRSIDLWVEFGSRDPSAEVRSTLDQILASLAVAKYEPPTQPDGLCSDWFPNDPDCSETRWLLDVIAESGLQADTGDSSAPVIIIHLSDERFRMTVREPDFPVEDLPIVFVVDGIEVHGGAYLTWRTQGRVIRIWHATDPAYPWAESEMSPLVRASLTVSFPG